MFYLSPRLWEGKAPRTSSAHWRTSSAQKELPSREPQNTKDSLACRWLHPSLCSGSDFPQIHWLTPCCFDLQACLTLDTCLTIKSCWKSWTLVLFAPTFTLHWCQIVQAQENQWSISTSLNSCSFPLCMALQGACLVSQYSGHVHLLSLLSSYGWGYSKPHTLRKRYLWLPNVQFLKKNKKCLYS
jgi:hypothetical protein